MPKTVAITGASGLVGTALGEALRERGDTVRKLVRRPPKAVDEVRWDPKGGSLASEVLDGVDGAVHLAGKNIGGARWTPGRKKEILSSRVEGTRVIAEALARGGGPGPRFLVSASAAGIYGDRGDELLDEGSALGTGFLAEVCTAWEGAADPARAAGVRVVHPRFGVVFSPAGGALAKMLPAFRLGAGGRLGSGRQYMPYVSVVDAIAALLRFVDDEALDGPFNVVAPTPATNAELTQALGRALSRPTYVPAPAFALRLALGEMADEMLLASQRVAPKRLEEAGFEFAHETIGDAVRSAIGD